MQTKTSIRHSAIAGTWYAGDAGTLLATLDEFFAHVPPQPLQGSLRALIAPHAGYAFSGPTAAHSYKQVHGAAYDTVIIAGPSHFEWVGEYAISSESAYQTPLGEVPLDEEWIAALEKRLPLARVRRDREHSIEIQLPFLQAALGTFKFVPILMNADGLEACVELGRAIAATEQALGKRPALLIASTDLNHMDSYRAVVSHDAEVVRALEQFSLDAMARTLLDPAYTVCGRAPVLAVCAAAQALGARRVQVLAHTNSGDVTGQTAEGHYTVGYLSAALLA